MMLQGFLQSVEQEEERSSCVDVDTIYRKNALQANNGNTLAQLYI